MMTKNQKILYPYFGERVCEPDGIGLCFSTYELENPELRNVPEWYEFFHTQTLYDTENEGIVYEVEILAKGSPVRSVVAFEPFPLQEFVYESFSGFNPEKDDLDDWWDENENEMFEWFDGLARKKMAELEERMTPELKEFAERMKGENK